MASEESNDFESTFEMGRRGDGDTSVGNIAVFDLSTQPPQKGAVGVASPLAGTSICSLGSIWSMKSFSFSSSRGPILTQDGMCSFVVEVLWLEGA